MVFNCTRRTMDGPLSLPFSHTCTHRVYRSRCSQQHYRRSFVLRVQYQHRCETHSLQMCAFSHTHTRTHTNSRSSVLVSWLPYCTLSVFNKWSSVHLCVGVCDWGSECVVSSVSPSGLMSHPVFPPPRWQYSALLITHHHLHSSWEQWHETQHTRAHWVRVSLLICEPFTVKHQRVCASFILRLSWCGCFLQPPQCLSFIAAQWRSMMGRQRSRWVPQPPLQAVTGCTEGSQHQTPFHSSEWTCLIYIHTLSHKGTPISQCHSCFVQQLCIYVCECAHARVVALFNQRACYYCLVCAWGFIAACIPDECVSVKCLLLIFYEPTSQTGHWVKCVS